MALNNRISTLYNKITSQQPITFTGQKTVDLKQTDIILPTPKFPKTIKARGFIFFNKIPRRYKGTSGYAFRVEQRGSSDKRYYLALMWVSNGKGSYDCTVHYATNSPKKEHISWI